MKNELLNVVKFVIAGVMGVLIGGLILPYLYNYNASKLSAYATALGAIGTVGALFYAIYQGSVNANQQRDFQNQQHKKWEEETKVTRFQQYIEHRKLFFGLLDELEFKHPVIFTNRSGLYRLVFPKNCPSFCSFEIKTSNNPAVLFNVRENVLLSRLNNIEANLVSYPCITRIDSKNNIESLIVEIVRLTGSLHLKFTTEGNFGELMAAHIENQPVINLFDPITTYRVLCKISSEIQIFGGFPPIPMKNLSSAVRHTLQTYFFDWQGALKLSCADLEQGETLRRLQFLYELERYIKAALIHMSKDDEYYRGQLRLIQFELSQLFNCKDNMYGLVSSNVLFKQSTGRYVSTLEEIRNKSSKCHDSEELSRLLQFYYDHCPMGSEALTAITQTT